MSGLNSILQELILLIISYTWSALLVDCSDASVSDVGPSGHYLLFSHIQEPLLVLQLVLVQYILLSSSQLLNGFLVETDGEYILSVINISRPD